MSIIPNLSESSRPGPKAFEDFTAADTVRRLREDSGKTWHGLAIAIKRAAVQNGWNRPDGLGTVDASTIQAIELGHLPSLRVQVLLALYFKTDRRDIWKPENRRPVLREKAAA